MQQLDENDYARKEYAPPPQQKASLAWQRLLGEGKFTSSPYCDPVRTPTITSSFCKHFICVGKALWLPMDDHNVPELCRTLYTESETARHFRKGCI